MSIRIMETDSSVNSDHRFRTDRLLASGTALTSGIYIWKEWKGIIMVNKRIRISALKKAVLKAFITAALLGAMSLPVCAYTDAGSTARVYMEEKG